jgi:hypothetical protein
MAASWCPGLQIVSRRAAIRVSMDTDVGGPSFTLAFHDVAASHPVSGWACRADSAIGPGFALDRYGGCNLLMGLAGRRSYRRTAAQVVGQCDWRAGDVQPHSLLCVTKLHAFMRMLAIFVKSCSNVVAFSRNTCKYITRIVLARRVRDVFFRVKFYGGWP